MGFLKRYLIAGFVLWLSACTGKVAQQPTKKQEPFATTPVAELQQQPAAKVLPQFALLDASGKTLDIQDFKGKKIFVNLWATWCPPCRAEMPSIAKLYEAADKEKVQFVLLSLDTDFETAKKYVQENKLNVPVFFPAGDLPELLSVNNIPTTFIFDEQGRLTAQHEGSENYNTVAYRKLFGASK